MPWLDSCSLSLQYKNVIREVILIRSWSARVRLHSIPSRQLCQGNPRVDPLLADSGFLQDAADRLARSKEVPHLFKQCFRQYLLGHAAQCWCRFASVWIRRGDGRQIPALQRIVHNHAPSISIHFPAVTCRKVCKARKSEPKTSLWTQVQRLFLAWREDLNLRIDGYEMRLYTYE
jgi:hypothetical protein